MYLQSGTRPIAIPPRRQFPPGHRGRLPEKPLAYPGIFGDASQRRGSRGGSREPHARPTNGSETIVHRRTRHISLTFT